MELETQTCDAAIMTELKLTFMEITKGYHEQCEGTVKCVVANCPQK